MTQVQTVRDEAAQQNEELHKEAASYLATCTTLIITNDETLQKADELVSAGLKQEKKIKAWFKPLKDAAKKAHTAVCDREKESLLPVTKGSRLLADRIRDYRLELQKKHEAQVKAAQTRAANKRKKEAEELRKKGLSEPEVQDRVASLPAPPMKTWTPPKTKTTTFTTYKVKVVDRKKVPAQFWMINQAALDGHAQSTQGKDPIPGCVIESFTKSRRG